MLLFISVLLVLTFVSCQDDIEKSGLSIVDVSPGGGIVGTTVTITGEGFSPSAQENTLLLGDRELTVLSATDTSIQTRLPEDIPLNCYSLSVKRAGFVSTSRIFCVTEFPLPVITGISPEVGRVGDLITVYGENLGASIQSNLVSFSNQDGSILLPTPERDNDITVYEFFADIEFATVDSLQVRVPAEAGTGPLYLWVDPKEEFDSYASLTGPDFTVIP